MANYTYLSLNAHTVSSMRCTSICQSIIFKVIIIQYQDTWLSIYDLGRTVVITLDIIQGLSIMQKKYIHIAYTYP